MLPTVFFDDPGGESGAMMYNTTDVSQELAANYKFIPFDNSEMSLSKGLFLHNASICNFFSTSMCWLIKFSFLYNRKFYFFKFLNFYFRNSFSAYFTKIWVISGNLEDHKIGSHVFRTSAFARHSMFLWRFYRNFPYDSLNFMLSNSLFFNKSDSIKILTNSLKFRLFNKFFFIEKFLKKLGTYLKLYYFKK
jgi:hypothetical protein